MFKLKVPIPSKEYDETIKRGFQKYKERENNYNKYLDYKKNIQTNSVKKDIDFVPIKMDIELSNKCNLKCTMCYLQFNTSEKYKLSFEKIKQIIDENIGLIDIRIQGISEPFLESKTLIKSIEYAANLDIWTRTTTNGSLLHKDQNYKKIIDAGIGEIGISIDGNTKKTYEEIRIGGNFEIVCNNSKLINSYSKSKGIQKTRMWVVVQKSNIDELMNFPKFASDLGFERLTFSLSVIDWGMDEMNQINEGKNVNLNEEILNALIKLGNEFGVDVSFWDHSAKFNKNNICNWPFERSFISSDGSVVPCCVLPGPKVMNFGNVNFNEFNKIWFSKTMNNFRQLHINNNIPNACKECYENR